MRVYLDALYFEFEGGGGVGRIFQEALARVLDRERDLRVTALTTGRLRAPLPAHPHLETRRISGLAHWSKALARGRFPWGRIPWAARSRALSAALEGTDPGLWHSTYYTRPRGWRGPSLVILYDLIHERYPELFPQDRLVPGFKAEAVKSADHVACISESARRDAVEFYGLPEAKTSVLYLAAGIRDPSTGTAPRSPYLLYVGKRFSYKNFDGLLTAFAAWEHRGEFALLCAGGGPLTESERSVIDKLGLAGRVRHMGRVDDAELAGLYAGASCFVYPSLYEGFGLPVLEAYQAGCPVALSRTSSLPEVGGEAGFYFDPQDPGDIGRALSEAVSQQGVARTERAEAARRHASRFSWEETASRLADLYRRLA